MCDKCHHSPCCCPQPGCPEPCQDCGQPGCVQPDYMIVRKSCKPDVCSPWIDLIKELLCAGKPACKLAFGQAIVSQKTVTIVAQNGNGSLEYSIDGVLFQDSPTFLNQPCGNHKYFVREKSNSACIAAGYAFIACDCIPEWKNTEEPPLTQCINGKVHSYQTDGCGNFDYKLTNENCPPPCVPVWVDVAPQETQCVGGKIQVKIQDGCGSFGWRLTEADCNVCVAPQVPQATISQASCLNGSPAGDAGIHFVGVSAADRYGYSQGAIYSGAAYAQAQAMPVGGNLDITGLAGSGDSMRYTCFILMRRLATGTMWRPISGNCWATPRPISPIALCQRKFRFLLNQ